MNSTLEEARRLFFQGIEYFEARCLEDARSAFEAALALTPDRPSVLGNLGITLFHLGEFDSSIPLLKKATDADPAYREAWTCLALSLQSLHRWQETVETLDRMAKHIPLQEELSLIKGNCLMQIGNIPDALSTFDEALLLAPASPKAWSAKGSVLREINQIKRAAECFEKAIALGDNTELTQYYLASVKPSASAPASPPREYVESLFDEYAADFQEHVTGGLRYEGYQRLLNPLIQADYKFAHALDLGCGTGLCGPLIHSIAQVTDGIDISKAMLDQAQQLGIYRRLIHADINEYLQTLQETADLIIAADVFIYIGKLDQIFRSARRLIANKGCFAFTVEESESGQDLQLLPSLRYAHSEQYIRRLATDCNFHLDRIFRAPIRYDQSRPIQGLYVYLS